MSLSVEQLVARQGKMTASRVKVLMMGDVEGTLRLYREMIGELPEENLDDVWAVQLGACTEKLNLDWYEKKNGVLLADRGKVVTHPRWSWAAATLDGFDTNLVCPVETKHTGGHEPMEVIIDRYQPQMQWQMECTSSKKCALSVIMGGRVPVVEYIDRSPLYTEEMMRRAEYFMMCVDLRTPPVEMAEVPPPADPTEIIDMNQNNQWADQAITWMSTKDAAVQNKDAEKVLKGMVPENAKRVFGHGIRITRDRAGRLSLRKDE